MKPLFQTNIDICKGDVSRITEMWPEDLVPRVGERIQMLHYELEVASVRYEPFRSLLLQLTLDALGRQRRRYCPVIELHTPKWFTGDIQEWEKHVKRQRASFWAEGKTWPWVDKP